MAGVGGRTVAEAKAALGWTEFHHWMAYREKHGPLHAGKRIEDAAALIALHVNAAIPRSKGAKSPRYEDFQLYRRASAEPEAVIVDLATAMERWK